MLIFALEDGEGNYQLADTEVHLMSTDEERPRLTIAIENDEIVISHLRPHRRQLVVQPSASNVIKLRFIEDE